MCSLRYHNTIFFLHLDIKTCCSPWDSGLQGCNAQSLDVNFIMFWKSAALILSATNSVSQHHIPEDLNLQEHCCENFKTSHITATLTMAIFSMLVTFVIWFLWRNKTREWENMFTKSIKFAPVGLNYSLVTNKQISRWIITTYRHNLVIKYRTNIFPTQFLQTINLLLILVF